ncbi:ABC transporter permease [Limimaricola cinnabarinus]|uniref:Pyrimidine ABC transporter, transmembrane component 1 n=1 Tax=Limimaricola cinnabarinus LL-001 TaxID=1337093 RepID=U3AA34_9RHOB|nr:ABC transporter permease [Limimaricola cinnabarinus]GAD54534.1 pyrimidine ABC transporter, transmembrane component 1 [Limimaricola cinnabarinus LL-001]
MSRYGPLLLLVAALFALWYAAAVPMNIREALSAAERNGVVVEPATAIERRDANALGLVAANLAQIPAAWAQDRPRLPAPHQIVGELWQSVVMEEIEGQRGLLKSGSLSNRGLLLHVWITLSATALGFVIGTVAGVLLAVGIVHSRTMERSVMPWAIVSQTVPIVALAPMIVVVLYSVGLQGLLPKAIISAYLSFFPVVVGMVKGLRAPDAMQTDLMRTWDASGWQVLTRLRLPASMPYLFASLKIAVAAALVGAIVGELPVQGGGLGARMLAGSYYGQTAQIWAALLLAAALAAGLVAAIGGAQRLALRRMGGAA